MTFADEVYALTKTIPRGRVTTYGEIARALGTRAYRAVGRALHVNPYAAVPCHRVVASDGSLHGFASGLRMKAALLREEGIQIVDGKVNLTQYFFMVKKEKGHKVPLLKIKT